MGGGEINRGMGDKKPAVMSTGSEKRKREWGERFKREIWQHFVTFCMRIKLA